MQTQQQRHSEIHIYLFIKINTKRSVKTQKATNSVQITIKMNNK